LREEFWTEETRTTISEFVGYITTWSGYQNYCKNHGAQAGEEILTEFTSRYQITLLLKYYCSSQHLSFVCLTFGDSCLKAYEDNKDEGQFTIRRKYFLLMGRKGKE
jgi:hypothetical protein